MNLFSDICFKSVPLPFRAPVVIVPLDGGCGLLETDVIEAGKGGTADVFDSVVWN